MKATTEATESGRARLKTSDFLETIEMAATKAAPIFQMMGWTYGGPNPPTFDEIEETIRGHVEHAIKNQTGQCWSGRFGVIFEKFEESDRFQLNIVLELAEAITPLPSEEANKEKGR